MIRSLPWDTGGMRPYARTCCPLRSSVEYESRSRTGQPIVESCRAVTLLSVEADGERVAPGRPGRDFSGSATGVEVRVAILRLSK